MSLGADRLRIAPVEITGFHWTRRARQEWTNAGGRLTRKQDPRAGRPSSYHFLPASVGLLQAYVQKHAPEPARYEFLLPLYRRLPVAEAVRHVLGAAYAGAAGALLAQTTGYVSLDVLEFQRSADVLLTLIIGGVGWLYGGIVGAIAFKILQDVLSTSSPQFWMLWMGVFLVSLALVGRERLAVIVRGLVARVVRS